MMRLSNLFMLFLFSILSLRDILLSILTGCLFIVRRLICYTWLPDGVILLDVGVDGFGLGSSLDLIGLLSEVIL